MRIDEILQFHGLPAAECELLLSFILNKGRTWILAHGDYELTSEEKKKWNLLAERRKKHEPIEYILAAKEFYGREFSVSSDVLIPRPATEGLVATALAWLESPSNSIVPIDAGIVALSRTLREGNARTVVDVGTGSGCIAITLALERPDLRVIATDRSEAALKVARKNAVRHNVESRIAFLSGSLLDPLNDLREPFLLVSNPPYVPSVRSLPKEIVDFEPEQAIFAGEDGLSILRPLIAQAKRHPCCLGFVVECEEEQVSSLDA